MEELLKIENLSVEYRSGGSVAKAVNGLNFTINKGEAIGLVGESGAGKTTTALSVLNLLPKRIGYITEGDVIFNGESLIHMNEKKLQKIRGKKIAMVFQNPLSSLNPVFTVGQQIELPLLKHQNMSRKEAKEEAVKLLNQVGISETRLCDYPHQFSGGMRQRVGIAAALACSPELLICDEPTTALDVTIQAQILELMQSLQKKLGMAIIMVTHDLGVIADMCDEIIVMYGGRVCERGTAEDIFYRPHHEYTKGLLRSIPNVDRIGEKLIPIPGTPINLLNMPKGCAFCPRCEEAMKICIEEQPPEMQMPDGHFASCWLNVKAAMEEEKGGRQ